MPRDKIRVIYNPKKLIFESIAEAAAFANLSDSKFTYQIFDTTKLDWDLVDTPLKKLKLKTDPWTAYEDKLLYKNREKPLCEICQILVGRSLSAIRNRAYEKGFTVGAHKRNNTLDPDYLKRPLTDETAYQIRLEYADKLEKFGDSEKAIEWCTEANDRAEEIVRDCIFNHEHDEAVEAARIKNKKLRRVRKAWGKVAQVF